MFSRETIMLDVFGLIDFRLLLILSPITTAIAWTMVVHELVLKHPWRP
jgi:hypothetical protein